MRVALLHTAVTADSPPEDQDVLVQIEAVSQALIGLGHEPVAIPCTLELAAMRDHLSRLRPDVVFNLVESLGGTDALAHLAPAVLDALGMPYTGAPTEGLFLTNHKLLAKERLRGAGLPTPAWVAEGGWPRSEAMGGRRPSEAMPQAGWIIKSVWEHASRGLDDQSLVPAAEEAELGPRLRRWAAASGRPCFAEQFVEGREFNLSLLAGADGPQVLPPAEIDFSAFPAGKPRIVGHRAKWQEDSFEYHHTPRHFDFPAADRPLLDRLQDLARQCWRLFGLRGYVRVDFRVDADARPWILEVNANPCLSPDAGFAATVQQAGIPFAHAVRRILADV